VKLKPNKFADAVEVLRDGAVYYSDLAKEWRVAGLDLLANWADHERKALLRSANWLAIRK
jgi:hypothetical protein